jgi:hypothetical protein
MFGYACNETETCSCQCRFPLPTIDQTQAEVRKSGSSLAATQTPKARSPSSMSIMWPSVSRQWSSRHSTPTSAMRISRKASWKKLSNRYCRQMIDAIHQIFHQPDRPFCHRWSGRRLRGHRSENHCRHLRRQRLPRRRRLLRQGSIQSRSVFLLLWAGMSLKICGRRVGQMKLRYR